MMKSFKEQSQAVAHVLFERWNPLGIGSDGPKDEYDSFAPRLIGLASRGETDAEIAEYLADIEVNQMGLRASQSANRLAVAALIRAAVDDSR